MVPSSDAEPLEGTFDNILLLVLSTRVAYLHEPFRPLGRHFEQTIMGSCCTLAHHHAPILSETLTNPLWIGLDAGELGEVLSAFFGTTATDECYCYKC